MQTDFEDVDIKFHLRTARTYAITGAPLSKGYVMAKKPILKNSDNELPELASKWDKAVSKLDAAKREELELRNKIVEKAFAGAPEGANSVELLNGTIIKADIKINRTVVVAQLEAATAYAIEKNDSHLRDLLSAVIRYKPDVVVGAFKAASAEDKKRLGDIIQERLGTAQLEVKFATGDEDAN